MAAILAKVRAGQHVDHLQTVRVRKDGTVFPVSLTVSPIRDAQGSGHGVRQAGCLDRLTWLFVSLGTMLFALEGPSSM
jgi:hypothetical protein